MLRAVDFRKDFYPFMRLMVSTGAYVDFAYKGRVYRVQIEDVGAVEESKSNPTKKRATSLEIIRGDCAQCGGVTFNDVCMSPNHPAS